MLETVASFLFLIFSLYRNCLIYVLTIHFFSSSSDKTLLSINQTHKIPSDYSRHKKRKIIVKLRKYSHFRTQWKFSSKFVNDHTDLTKPVFSDLLSCKQFYELVKYVSEIYIYRSTVQCVHL